MKYKFEIILVLILTLNFSDLKAENLFDSLNAAYLNNPKLNAERASMRASIEEKRESVSEFLPSVTLEGYVSGQDNTNHGDDTYFEPSEQSVTIKQKIFQGASGLATFMKKQQGQKLGEFNFWSNKTKSKATASDAVISWKFP